MADTNTTIKFQYGLLYASLNVDNGQAGDKVYVYSCNANQSCFQEEYTFLETPEEQGMVFLGELNRSKRMDGKYANVQIDYATGKNIYIVVIRTEVTTEGEEETTSYRVIKRYESPADFTIELESTAYELSLDKDENDCLITDEGLNMTVIRPASTSIFDDVEYTYKLNIYRFPEYDITKEYKTGDVIVYNGKIYRACFPVGTQSPPETQTGGNWAEYNPFAPKYNPWEMGTKYIYGDIVLYGGTPYRCNVPFVQGFNPTSPAGASVWIPYTGTEGIDGQTLIQSITLTADGPIESMDKVTKFSPNKNYTYVLTLHAEQPRVGTPIRGGEYLCSTAYGKTTSCLLFDPSATGTMVGELCVVDEEDNIVSTQNAEAGQSYPRPEQEKDNDWITFGIMPTDSRCLNIVAFVGDETARTNFIDWLESDGGCLEYAYLGYADIPNEIQNYNPVISGTVQMQLDKVNDISYDLNLPETVYTGSPIEIPSEGYGVTNLSDPGITVQYALKDPETGEYGEYSSSITVGPDVGTYGVKVKLSLENYAETEAEGELQITPAEITGITISGWEGDYDADESRTITLEGCQDDDVITYSEDTETYQEEAFSYSDVGTYTVYVNVSRPNYNDWRGSASITINPISITGITITGFRGADDGQPHSITIAGVLDSDTVLYSTNGITYDLIENPEFSGVGSHTVYVKVTRDNHNDWYANAVVDITEKPIFTITISGYEGSFDGEEHGITLGGTEVGDIISYSDDGSVYDLSESPKYAAVGTYEVYAKVERAGYEDWVGHAFINITAANINDVTIKGYSGTYDGSSHGITVTSRGGDSISYSTDASTYTSTNPEFTNAGEYVVYVKVEREGYNDFTGSGTVNITKKTTTLTFEVDDRDYDGTTTADIAGYTFSGLVDGETASVTGYVGAFENKNAGEDKEVTVSGYTISGINLDNYDIEIASAYATIAQRALTVTFTVSNKTYNASNNATVTNTSIVGKLDGDVVNTSNVTATFADANVGNDKEVTITYNLSGSDAINYSYESPVSTQANITPATITGIRAVDGGGDYTGSPYQISVSGTRTGDTILYSTDGETYSATNPSFTEVGTYTVYVKVSRANYNDWTGQADVVINAVVETVWVMGIIPLVYATNDPDVPSAYATNANGLAVSGDPNGKDIETIVNNYLNGKTTESGTMSEVLEQSVLGGETYYLSFGKSNADWTTALANTGASADDYPPYEGYPFFLTNEEGSYSVVNNNGTPQPQYSKNISIEVNGVTLNGLMSTTNAAASGLSRKYIVSKQ